MVLAGVLAAASGLGSCGRGGGDWRQAQPAAPATPNDETTGYMRPPQLTGAVRGADGSVVLSGRAEPDVRVRLSSPDGQAYGATAADDGGWSASIPTPTVFREFGMSEEVSGRTVQGEGYVAVLPGSGPAAALLRAGEGAIVMAAPAAGSKIGITAVDFDAGGGAVVSGVATPATALRLSIDNNPAGEGRSDEKGRFSVSSATMLKPGDHTARLTSGTAAAQAEFSVGAPVSIIGLPYHGQRLSNGWRIDWVTPGGGPQTTLIFDVPES